MSQPTTQDIVNWLKQEVARDDTFISRLDEITRDVVHDRENKKLLIEKLSQEIVAVEQGG